MKKLTLLLIGLTLVAFTACSQDEPKSTADKVSESMHDAANATKEAAHDAGVAMQEAAHDAENAVKEAAHDAQK